MNFKNFVPKGKPLSAVLIVAIGALFFLVLYLGTLLRGNINYFMLPSAYFKVPILEQQHGIKPLYYQAGSAGWDGQFYFYAANDLLGKTDAAKIADIDSYRYQRIGLPLTAKIVSLATLQTWVTPLTYYSSNFLLVLFATYFFALFLNSHKRSVWYAIFWGLSYGVQITLSNALPDGAAEAYCILALYAYYRRNFTLYSLFATFSALSREEFILPFAVLGLLEVFSDISIYRLHLSKYFAKLGHYFLFAIPGIILLSWQIYITHHFGHSAASQAGVISSWPLYFYIKYLLLGLAKSLKRTMPLIFFMVLIGIALYQLVNILRKWSQLNIPLRNMTIAFLPVIILYLFFSKTVMEDITGYYKVAGLLYIVIPLAYIALEKKISHGVQLILLLGCLIGLSNFYCRVHSGLGQDLLETFPPITEKDKQNYPCIDSHPFQIQFLSAENFYTHPVFRALIGEQPVYSAYVQVTNLSHKTWQSSYGKGSINLSYRYIDPATGQIFRDGEPTFLTQPLAPGKTQAQHMLIFFPKTKIKNPIIRFTIQQQNCAWFDDDEKTGYVDVPLKSLPTLRNAQNF